MSKARKNSANTNKSSGNIRIIAGKHRGRKLPVIDAEGLRPTTDRVKETVFNWLMPYVQGSHCLDCFAGAGSLGFEALSRHAEHVTFLELNKQAAKQLIANKQLLGATNCEVFQTNTLEFLSTSASKQYDLIFIDPPFRQGLVEKVSNLLASGWLAPQAIIYLEQEAEATSTMLPDNWQPIKNKTMGQVSYQLYQLK